MADTPDISQIAAVTDSVARTNQQMSELNEKAKKANESFNKLSSSNVDLIKSFGSLTKETDSAGQGLLNLTKAVTKTFGTLQGFSNLLNNISDSILGSSQQLANAYDKSRADYVKSTGDVIGTFSDLSKVMRESSENISIFGVNTSNAMIAVSTTIPQVSKAYIEAINGVNSFGDAQQKNLANITTTVAQLEQLGISSKTSAENIRLISDSMGASATSTAVATDEMAKTTLALAAMNGSLTESAAIIQRNVDITLIFGTDALVTLQGQATATGIALDTLVGVSQKFNTFESAAEQVGKLNALLGADYLSVTEMMYAEPAEQVQMISEAFRDAGVSVESMDPIQKKFMLTTIQSTLGLKNQQEALRFLNADEFERGRMLADKEQRELKNAEIQERLNDGAILTYLKRNNIVSPNKPTTTNPSLKEAYEEYAGGYLKDPVPGLYEWVIDLDFTSLYPSIIRSLNIGIETFVGRIVNRDKYDNNWTLDDLRQMDPNEVITIEKLTAKQTTQQAAVKVGTLLSLIKEIIKNIDK